MLRGVTFCLAQTFRSLSIFSAVSTKARDRVISISELTTSVFSTGEKLWIQLCVLGGGGGRPAKMQRSQMTHQIELEWEKRNNINNNGVVEAFFYGFSSFARVSLNSSVCVYMIKNENEKTLNE